MKAAGYLKVEQTDFLSNYFGSFQELRNDGDLLDVTLACEDETFEAHKVVLSACSPFFRQIFRMSKQKHPFVYLKGIVNTDLTALLEYIYTGQTEVSAEGVNRFIKTAQELKISGLIEDIDESTCSAEEKSSEKISVVEKLTEKISVAKKAPKKESDENVIEEPDDYLFDNDSVKSLGVTSLQKEILSRMEKVTNDDGFMWKCKECGYKVKAKTKLGFHVETHLEGFTHTCELCDKVHKTRIALKTHINLKHKDLKNESEEDSKSLTPKQEKISNEDLNDDDNENEASLEELDGSMNDSLLEAIALQLEAEKLQNENLRSDISKRMTKFEDVEQGTMWKCTQCEKTLKKKNKLECHVETHLEGFTHTCAHCGKVHKTRVALKVHIHTHHKAI